MNPSEGYLEVLDTEMRGGEIWLKNIQYNVSSLTCTLSKGDLIWEQGFFLELVEEVIEVSRPAVVNVPSVIEAYSCDNPGTIPTAQVTLYSID